MIDEETKVYPKGVRHQIIKIPHPEFGHVDFINMSARQKDVLAHYLAILDSKKDEHKN